MAAAANNIYVLPRDGRVTTDYIHICPNTVKTTDACVTHFRNVKKFTFHRSKPDGNCFYHSLANFGRLTGFPSLNESNSDLRAELVDYVEEHLSDEPESAQYTGAYFIDNDNIGAQLEEMRTNGAYYSEGGDMVPQVAAKVFNINILVFDVRRQGTTFYINRINCPALDPVQETVFLLRTGQHYDLLMRDPEAANVANVAPKKSVNNLKREYREEAAAREAAEKNKAAKSGVTLTNENKALAKTLMISEESMKKIKKQQLNNNTATKSKAKSKSALPNLMAAKKIASQSKKASAPNPTVASVSPAIVSKPKNNATHKNNKALAASAVMPNLSGLSLGSKNNGTKKLNAKTRIAIMRQKLKNKADKNKRNAAEMGITVDELKKMQGRE